MAKEKQTKIERFVAVDRCLWWEEKKILVIGDLHLGYEESLNETGVSVPRTQLQETVEILKKIFLVTGKLKEVVLLGDVKHWFASVLRQEMNDVLNVFELIKKNLEKDGRIIITKGNHDNILESISRNYDYVELLDKYVVEDVLFFHGDKESWEKSVLEIADKKIKTIVCGHYHPAIFLREGEKVEKYKCFLYNSQASPIGDEIKQNSLHSSTSQLSNIAEKNKRMIVVPSFFPLIEGSDILHFVQPASQTNRKKLGNITGKDWKDFSDFSVFAVDDESSIYEFGKVKKLR